MNSPSTLQARPAEGYAGDVSPELAHQWFSCGEAVLVDIRSSAEIEWVGFVPGSVHVAWKQWPGMAMNASFDAELQAAAQGKKVVLLCFEGDANEHGHRGHTGGWRQRGLPWRQN